MMQCGKTSTKPAEPVDAHKFVLAPRHMKREFCLDIKEKTGYNII